MSGAFLAALLAISGVELDIEARASKEEGGFDLRLSGKARDLPEGAIVRLRFRRMVNRVRGAGRVLAGGPEEAAWVRRVAVRKGAFLHREVFAAPGVIEVEAAFDPAEQERAEAARGREPAAVVRIFHVASPVETAWALRREARAIRESLAEACRWEGEAGKERARRKLAALREEEPRAQLSGTISLLAKVLEEYLVPARREGGVHGPDARILAVHGEGWIESLEVVREVFHRERVILAAREAGRLQGEGIEKALAALRGACADDEALLEFLREVEADLRAGDPGKLRERAAAIEARARSGR